MASLVTVDPVLISTPGEPIYPTSGADPSTSDPACLIRKRPREAVLSRSYPLSRYFPIIDLHPQIHTGR